MRGAHKGGPGEYSDDEDTAREDYEDEDLRYDVADLESEERNLTTYSPELFEWTQSLVETRPAWILCRIKKHVTSDRFTM